MSFEFPTYSRDNPISSNNDGILINSPTSPSSFEENDPVTYLWADPLTSLVVATPIMKTGKNPYICQ